MTEPKTLLSKLHEAQKDAKAVAKQGENKAQHYKYARAEDVITEAQRALQGAGLVGFMAWSTTDNREIVSGSGTAGLFTSAQGELRILDPDSGETLNIPAFGTGADYPGDKAVYKAMTGGAKYAYASALGIPFGDDPEDEATATTEPRQLTGEATKPQKGAISAVLNRVGVPKELQVAMVHAIAGDPPSKSGASDILDILKDDSRGTEGERVDVLYSMAGLPTQGSDVPADTEGLPELEHETSEMMFDPNQDE